MIRIGKKCVLQVKTMKLMMKRSIFLFLFASMALFLLASTPQVNRSQLKHAAVVKDKTFHALLDDGQDNAVSLQQALKERNLTLDDNKFNRGTPRVCSVDDLLGPKIAMAEAYNFDWIDSTGVAVIRENSCVMKGMSCKIISSHGKLYLNDFYGSYEIPISFDDAADVVRIQTNTVLDVITDGYAEDSKGSSPEIHYWTLYVMPLSWLTGDDECAEYIEGHVCEDGSIAFDEDFAFLVKTKVQGEEQWGMSPIFKNLMLLAPNGLHELDWHKISDEYQPEPIYIPQQEGHGGLVPRPVRPGSTKPVKPRAMNSVITGTCLDREGGSSPQSQGSFSSTVFPQNVSHPVYIYQLDESTWWVYNLFGMGNRCYMYLNNDGSMSLPGQLVFSDGLGKNYYSENCSGTWSSDGITWERTNVRRVAAGYPIIQLGYFTDNRLIFTTDMSSFGIPSPSFSYPHVTDNAVVFSAESDAGEVYMYVLDEETENYELVENPWAAPRAEEPYRVYLAARTVDEMSGECSEPAFYEYEVPALGDNIWHLDGELRYYQRAGKALIGSDGNYSFVEQEGDVIAVVNGNSIWLKNLLYDPNGIFADYWIEGTIDGNTITLALGQDIAYSPQDDAYIRLGWGTVSWRSNGSLSNFIHSNNTTATFTIDGDVLSLRGTSNSSYRGVGLAAYWSNDNSFGDAILFNTTLSRSFMHRTPVIYSDADINAMDGEMVTYRRTGNAIYCIYADYGLGLEYGDQVGDGCIFFAADGMTVYMRNPVYTLKNGMWMKGTRYGNTLSFPLGQYLYWDETSLLGLRTSWGTFVEGMDYIDDSSVTEVTFTIDGDNIYMNNGSVDEDYFNFVGLSLMNDFGYGGLNSEWYGGLDCMTVFGPVPSTVRGDVNGDSFVNIGDVTLLISALLTDDLDGISAENANCNHDESLNIGDVTTLINYLLTDQWPE